LPLLQLDAYDPRNSQHIIVANIYLSADPANITLIREFYVTNLTI